MATAPRPHTLGSLIDSPIPLVMSYMTPSLEEGAHQTETAKIVREALTLHLYGKPRAFDSIPFKEAVHLTPTQIEALQLNADGTSPKFPDSYFEVVAKMKELQIVIRHPLRRVENFKLAFHLATPIPNIRFPTNALYFALLHFGLRLPQVPIYCVEELTSEIGMGKEARVFEMGQHHVAKLYHFAHQLKGWDLFLKSFEGALQCAESAASVLPHPNVNRFEGLVMTKRQWGVVFAKIPGQRLRTMMGSLSDGEKVEVAVAVAKGMRHLDTMLLPHVDPTVDNIMLSGNPRGVFIIDFARRQGRGLHLLPQLRMESRGKFGTLLFIFQIHEPLARRCQSEETVEHFYWNSILNTLLAPPPPLALPAPGRKRKFAEPLVTTE